MFGCADCSTVSESVTRTAVSIPDKFGSTTPVVLQTMDSFNKATLFPDVNAIYQFAWVYSKNKVSQLAILLFLV